MFNHLASHGYCGPMRSGKLIGFSDVTILVFSSRFDFDSIFYKEFDVNSILISIFSSGNKLHKSN